MTPIFYGQVKNGRLKLDERDKFDSYLLGLEGEVTLILDKKKKERSNKQNRYYRGVVVKMISEAMGEIIQEKTHRMLGSLFLKDFIGKYEYVRSTTDLSTVEFENFLSECRIWASQELNLYIPNPNEVAF